MKKSRSFNFLVIVACFLLIGLLVSPFAYKQAKHWQAQRFYEQAVQHEKDRDYAGAVQKAEASFRLQTDNPAALMYLARLTLLLPHGHPQMSEWWEGAMRTPDCRPEDILQYIEVLVKHGDNAHAYPLVVSLRQLDPENERALDIQADLLMSERKMVQAERLLKEFLATHENASPETYQRLAEILLSFAADSQREEAKALLLHLSNTQGAPLLYALRRITRDAMFTSEERADAGEKLLALDGITIADHLTAYNALLEARRMRRTDIRDQLVALLQDESKKDPDAMARLGAWLINSDQSRYFLQLLTMDEARLDPNIFAARLMAMVRAGSADEVYGITFDKSDRNPLSPVENLLVRAEALYAQERKDEFLSTLQSLADSVTPENFRLIEQRLVSYGAYDILIGTYERLREDDHTRGFARRKLLLSYYFLGRERDLLTLLEDFDGYLSEEDPSTQAIICYLNSLYNREEEETIRIAESLVTRFPNIIDFRVVLAFEAMKTGRRDRVKALVGDLPLMPPDQQRYLRIAMLVLKASSGSGEALSAVAMELQNKELLPAERVLLQGI